MTIQMKDSFDTKTGIFRGEDQEDLIPFREESKVSNLGETRTHIRQKNAEKSLRVKLLQLPLPPTLYGYEINRFSVVTG